MTPEAIILHNLDILIKSLRTNDTEKSKRLFLNLIKEEIVLTQKITRKIYELGEVFSYIAPEYYVKVLNNKLKQQNSYLIRLLRQEIIYNSDYSIQQLFRINQKDLENFSNDPEFIHFKGMIYWDDGELEEAIKYIKIALETQPDNINFIRNYALLLTALRRYEESNQLIERALGIEPDYLKLQQDKEYIENQAQAHIIKDRFEASEKKIVAISDSLKTIKFDVFTITALFVAVLAVVIRMVTIDYLTYENLGFWEIFKMQLALNSSWLIGLLAVLLILVLKTSRNK